MRIISLGRRKTVINPSWQNHEIPFLQRATNPAFLCIADLELTLPTKQNNDIKWGFVGIYIKVSFSAENIANFLIGMEMFLVEIFDHCGVLFSHFLR
jgi:hypothetical protein